jgi:polyhydroxybutyrate depolymerase
MKKITLFISLTILSLTTVFGQNVYDSVYVGNRWRTYMTHLPTGYNPSNQYPLVLCFHGGQNGAQSSQLGWQAIAIMSNLSQKADTAGFIVVYPEGIVINNNRTWNAGGCCQPATTNNIDDVGFVNSLIDTLKTDYLIDSLRVYASGSSNGALLCYRLACELPNKIAAIASISGTQEYFPCNPTQKMPIINFHSKVDIAVPYNGGVGQGPSGTNFTSQDSTMQLWTALNNCSTRDTVFNGADTNYTFIRIHNCSCNVEFHHYATSDGGHSWPSGNPNNNPVSYQVNATNLLWSFFQNYTLGCLTTGLENPIETNPKVEVFPNPFTNKINLTKTTSSEILTLFNCCGQVIWTGRNIELHDFSNLTNGLYFLKITKPTGQQTNKLIKQ